jgi:uncharacterized protein (DUF305 family)
VGTRLAVRAALVLLLVAGCSEQPVAGGPAGPAMNSSPAFNDTDVMFLQMGLAQIAEGEDLAVLVAGRARDTRIRAVATELRGQWGEESGTMRRWLLGWQQPVTADPAAGAHAGHGDLHMLRPADLAELRSATDFDRTAVSLLLGHLGNCVETSRRETAGGAYPPARGLAGTMTTRRQSQVQRLLTLAARG